MPQAPSSTIPQLPNLDTPEWRDKPSGGDPTPTRPLAVRKEGCLESVQVALPPTTRRP